ncbi:NAD(P)H-dependent oxidoreductase [Streptomyces sp. B6B3]|uniref:NAD(P)H-dependent oxidoreductase n=1 Tax=Streptomyces sp. B6B3 TaxID=3153570 RepID=UPI00325D2C57
MTHVHVVYAHPSERSFTREVLDAFLGGLDAAGHTRTVSDLYSMAFRSELTPEEYERESGRRPAARVPDDVAAEHAKLAAADVWAFVYPVWWADCPARLKGWFDRVWTVGFAHKPAALHVARQALVLCTAGYTLAELDASGCYQAMRTTMLTDRVGGRARSSEFVVFGGSVLRGGESGGDRERWAALRAEHLARAGALARSI